MALTVTTHSKKETERLAALVVETLKDSQGLRAHHPFIVCLVGDLGTGKTVFTKAFARACGVRKPVPSPTFTIVRRYALPHAIHHYTTLYHIDAYRIQRIADTAAIGIRDIVKDPRAIIVIEWANIIKKIVPYPSVWLHIKHGKENVRRICITEYSK